MKLVAGLDDKRQISSLNSWNLGPVSRKKLKTKSKTDLKYENKNGGKVISELKTISRLTSIKHCLSKLFLETSSSTNEAVI